MKKFTRMFALVLVLVLSMSLLCGCSDNESIQGTWSAVTPDGEESTREFLESLGFYAEEIALIDLNSLESAHLLQFNADGTYELGYDAQGCKEAMAEFFDGMMDDLYNGRASLTSLYGEEVASVSREEFDLAYAEMFGCATAEEYRNYFVNDIVDFNALEAENETGKYNAALGKIYFTVDGASEAETAPYEIKNGKLIVTYSDMVVEYTKK